ncbi:DNA polymerase IV [Streptococcus loxodontisalivarius]|uniref:DNA polymerase IV n=1 Tax=Streptococcus loxodontisalivarius TaxID=1349415 RepID=A0ABS2PRF4_9STRE|nr:DNA polymerase IV [Streptococcus loxodontisalivarius]MBM7642506.1 DNA polymerase-4 [Streptococcus loxodontisalivarius]
MLEFPLINDTSRKIIHIDMDAFFAAVEERDNPSLKGKPVVIGSDPRKTGGRGVVSTCNYEARKFGIHSAMSSKEAFERCPQAVFISGNYSKYREVGYQVREIFKRYTDLVEPMSIDEAYLDVTENKIASASAVKIAKLIQHDIWKELSLTCSAGVSYNKFLAKLASDFQKPAGLTLILPDEAESFLADLPIEKFHGVGIKSVERLHEIGVFTGKDLQEVSENQLIDLFGRFGYDLYRKARGISNSAVKPNRIRKSIGSERTYAKLLFSEEDIKAELSKNAQRVADALIKNQKSAKSIVIKVRYSDFSTLTKRHSLEVATQDFTLIERQAHAIFDELEENQSGIRLLGVTATSLEDQSIELNLLEDREQGK